AIGGGRHGAPRLRSKFPPLYSGIDRGLEVRATAVIDAPPQQIHTSPAGQRGFGRAHGGSWGFGRASWMEFTSGCVSGLLDRCAGFRAHLSESKRVECAQDE